MTSITFNSLQQILGDKIKHWDDDRNGILVAKACFEPIGKVIKNKRPQTQYFEIKPEDTPETISTQISNLIANSSYSSEHGILHATSARYGGGNNVRQGFDLFLMFDK